MEIINLNIKKERLDLILQDPNKFDVREVRPNTDDKYLLIDDEGFVLQDGNGDLIPKTYDAIQYNVDGKLLDYLIGIDDIVCQILVDENGEVITYEHKGETHTSCQVVYTLGENIQK